MHAIAGAARSFKKKLESAALTGPTCMTEGRSESLQECTVPDASKGTHAGLHSVLGKDLVDREALGGVRK
jgi:hypothetical protein